MNSRIRRGTGLLLLLVTLAGILPIPATARPPIGDLDRPPPIANPAKPPESPTPRSVHDCPPPRHVRKGILIGGTVGAGAGFGFFLILGAIFDAIDNDDDALGTPAYLILGALGGAVGAVGGGIVGAHVGGQFRRGPTLCPDPVGSLTVQGGGVHHLVRDDADPGLFTRATLLTHWSAHVATGGEYARMTGTPEGWRLALATRIDPTGTTARLRPYGAGSLGGNFWQDSENLISADIGGGVDWSLSETWSVGAESRYHWNLQNAVEPGTYRFTSVVGTLRARW